MDLAVLGYFRGAEDVFQLNYLDQPQYEKDYNLLQKITKDRKSVVKKVENNIKANLDEILDVVFPMVFFTDAENNKILEDIKNNIMKMSASFDKYYGLSKELIPMYIDMVKIYIYAAQEIIKRPNDAYQIFRELQELAQTKIVQTILSNINIGYTPTFYGKISEDFYLIISAMIHATGYFKSDWNNILNFFKEKIDEGLDPVPSFALAASLVFPQIGMNYEDKQKIYNRYKGLKETIPAL